MKKYSLLFLLFMSSQALAVDAKCEKLIQEVRAMQKAQHQLLKSQVSKNELFVGILRQNAEKVEKEQALHLKQAAEAFHNHHQREAQLVQRFEKAADQLVNQILACIE